ncbi:MAG TPA: ribbon-helix-helix protein, CopG family [Rudaea sp.]|jgi:predicted transcriptional regulator|uniref:ribbon-helix-helix protein, CopG family n=1 Tax=Rudaea sp. TaxID=2136325 RepID=UPI002F924379
MQAETTRATIYLDKDLHKALRLKAADTRRSISEIVSNAVRESLREDEADLAIIAERASEKTISYEELLVMLKADGRI